MTPQTSEKVVPDVSVVIPAHNSERYLGAAIESVLAQADRVREIIVVDDGSTDASTNVAARFPGVICLHQPNRGPSSARNRGVAEARGEYVAFLDADDIWVPGKMSDQLRILDADPSIGLVFGDMQRFHDEAAVESSLFQRYGLTRERLGPPPRVAAAVPLLLALNPIATGTVVARRRCLVEAGLFDETLWHAEDWDLWIRVALRHPIGYSSRVCMWRRMHPENLSGDQVAMAEAGLIVFEKLRRVHGRELQSAGADIVRSLRDSYRNVGYLHLRALRLRQARRALARSLALGLGARTLTYWASTFLGRGLVATLVRLRG